MNTMRTEEKASFLKSHSVCGVGKVGIFGAGVRGKALYRLLKAFFIPCDVFLDTDPLKHNTFIMDDVACVSPENAAEHADEILIVVAVQKEPETIREDLLAKGFRHVVLGRDIDFESLIPDLLIEQIALMARTGMGTEKCLDAGVYPMPVHFYQPVPDIKNLERRDVWSKVSARGGLAWNPCAFRENAEEISRFKPDTPWPRNASSAPMEFSLENRSFSHICASFLYGMIRKYQPRRIVEIGSGNSSKVIRTALRDNAGDREAEYIIIDPHCAFEEVQFSPCDVTIMRQPMEETELSVFTELAANDILFIDSSHTVRIGGDVNFAILDVLPALAPGVIVHFHDIVMPYEYPKTYAVNPRFRVFWTESYLLQAFLAFNSEYEILLPAAWLCNTELETLKKCYPDMSEPFDWSSSSFWIRRKG